VTKRNKQSVASPTRTPIPPIPALLQPRTVWLSGEQQPLTLPKVPGRVRYLHPTRRTKSPYRRSSTEESHSVALCTANPARAPRETGAGARG